MSRNDFHIQGGPEVTLGLWNRIKRVKIHNMKKINLWNFRWQKSILEILPGTSNRLKIFQIVFVIWQIYDKIHLRKSYF